MKHARQVLAVALVATALCADRAAVAAPALRPQAVERAGGIVQRLTARLGRVVQRVTLVEMRREGRAQEPTAQNFAREIQTTDLRPWLRLSAPQLPLPPPVL
jgi:hypothetical protein